MSTDTADTPVSVPPHIAALVTAYANGEDLVVEAGGTSYVLQASLVAERALGRALYPTRERRAAALEIHRARRRRALEHLRAAAGAGDTAAVAALAAAHEQAAPAEDDAPQDAAPEDDANITAWDLLMAEALDLEDDAQAVGRADMRVLAQQVKWAAAVVKALLARHHPSATDNDVDDVLDALGYAPHLAVSLGLALYRAWVARDALGLYVAGGPDPSVTIGRAPHERVLTLRFRARALRHMAALLEAREPTFNDNGPIAGAALLHFHPELAHDAGILDDVAWRLGLGGLARLVGGPVQPTRLHAPETGAEGGEEGEPPNAPAPGAGETAPGTSTTGEPCLP